MQVSILSGKGGTGKTTVTVNLAAVTGWRYVDCDVEAPNGFIFLKPEVVKSREVTVFVPHINPEKCILCKECEKICQFHALGLAKDRVLVFEKLCHGCGACALICPENAILERKRNIGTIEEGRARGIACMQGVLKVGEPMAGPVIRDIKKLIKEGDSLIDCAPGSSCNVVKAIEGSDYALLVTEPTEFGLHDLRITVRLVRKMGIPFSLILNRADQYHNMITDYCRRENIRFLGVIPFDKKAALMYSQGQLLVKDKYYRQLFEKIGRSLLEVVRCS